MIEYKRILTTIKE